MYISQIIITISENMENMKQENGRLGIWYGNYVNNYLWSMYNSQIIITTISEKYGKNMKQENGHLEIWYGNYLPMYINYNYDQQ